MMGAQTSSLSTHTGPLIGEEDASLIGEEDASLIGEDASPFEVDDGILVYYDILFRQKSILYVRDFIFSEDDLDFLAEKYSRHVRDIAAYLSANLTIKECEVISNYFMKCQGRFKLELCGCNKLMGSLIIFKIMEDYWELKRQKKFSTVHIIEYCATVLKHKPELSQFCRTLLSGSTPLHLAVQYRSCDMIRMLEQFILVATIEDKYGNTALHYACLQGYETEAFCLMEETLVGDVMTETTNRIKRLKLQNNYLCLTTSGDGNTPLHYACFHPGQADLVKKLVDCDSSCLLVKNRAKKFPLQVALQHHNFEYVGILLKACCIRAPLLKPFMVDNATIEEYVQVCKQLLHNSVNLKNIIDWDIDDFEDTERGLLPIETGFHLLKNLKHCSTWYMALPQNFTTEKIQELLNAHLKTSVTCNTYKTYIDPCVFFIGLEHTVSLKPLKDTTFALTIYEIDELLLVWSNSDVHIAHCINSVNRLHSTTLYLSTYSLMNCGVNTKNDFGRTPFDEAYLIEHITACVWLMVIKQCSIYLNICDVDRHRAVEQICKNTLARFPKDSVINSIVPGDTLLHVAASMSNGAELIHYLTVTMKFDVTKVNSRQEYPLHIACRAGHKANVIKLLINCDLLHQNVEGDSPLDLLFVHYRYEYVVSVLHLDQEAIFLDDLVDVDKWMKNNEKYSYYDNNSPLHIAVGTCSEAEVLMGINSVSFLKWSCWRNIFGELPIHWAARKRNLNLMKLVSTQENCNAVTDQENSAIHELCKTCSNSDKDLEALKFLHEDLHCNIHTVNGIGRTALHICCIRGCSKLVEYLLNIPKLDPNAKDNTGATPLMVTPLGHCEVIRLLVQHGADSSCLYHAYKSYFMNYSSETPPPTPLNVIVVGNHSSGKSTLIEALKSEYGTNIVQAEPLTAGIIPSFTQSRNFGNIMWYDLAGHSEYYASHEAVLNTVMTSSPPLVLLLVDIRKPQEVIHQEILYWLHFLQVQVELKKFSVQPHISVVFSFKDDLVECAQEILDFTKVALKPFFKKCNFEFVSFMALDCRQPNSAEINLLRSQIQNSYSILCDKTQINFLLHCFFAFLLGNFKNEPAVTMHRVLDLTEEWIATGIDPLYEQEEEEDDSDESVESFDPKFHFYFEEKNPAKLLPKDHEHVFDMCKRLHDKGHVMVIKDSLNTAKNGWIIINKDIILKEVNGSLFAPEKFKKHYKDISTSIGVVTLSKLSEIFSDFDSDILSGFLTYLEFCTEISDRAVLQLLEVKTESSSERFFFFPGLVNIEKPEWVWRDKVSFNKFGWILHSTEPNVFFTPRFIQVLLLRLAFSYPLASRNKTTGLPSLTLTQACSVWKNGLFWQTDQGLDCLVEVTDKSQALILLLRSTDQPLSDRCLHLSFQYRSNLISSILAIVKELASSLNLEECIIHPNSVTSPPPKCEEAALYSTRAIAKAICSKLPFVPSTSPKFDKAKLTDILNFEPFLYTDNYHLFNKSIQNSEVIDEELHQLSLSLTSAGPVCCGVCYSIFSPNKATLFSGAAVNEEIMCRRLIEWRNEKKATCGDLHSLLAQYSVFGERNIQEIGGCDAVEIAVLSGETPGLPKDIPTLPSLISFKCKDGRTINILERIGDKYCDFGILLLNDDDGSKVKAITHENRGEIKPILRDIVNRWLQGEGRSVSWTILVEILENIQLFTLSEDIHSSFQ